MRILWVCNVPIPRACEAFNIPISPYGGWLINGFAELQRKNNIELVFAFPDNVESVEKCQEFIRFPRFRKAEEICDDDIKNVREVLNQVLPDVLHIFGSELSHSLAFAKEFDRAAKTIVSIQGIISSMASKYCLGIPTVETIIPSFAELVLKTGSLNRQKHRFEKRGENEIALIKSVGIAIGRTSYDRKFVDDTNKGIQYLHCPETLRDEFYQGDIWKYRNAEQYSLFMSQASYPIKGIHILLHALGIVKKDYPNFVLYVGGPKLTATTMKNRFFKSSYQRYVRRLLSKYDLSANVVFLGDLSAIQMKKMYMRSNVFVLPSIVENSPNSLGEAMVLGIPVIAANVGGIPDILGAYEDCLYKCEDYYELSQKIEYVFQIGEKAEIGQDTRIQSAKDFFDSGKNVKVLADLYYSLRDEQNLSNEERGRVREGGAEWAGRKKNAQAQARQQSRAKQVL